MMRLLVCGSRNWREHGPIRREILARQPDIIIEGGAPGADLLSRDVAIQLGISFLEFSAEWKRYGRAAGPIRNKRQLVEGKPDEVIAFHQDIEQSKGTADMVKQALKKGIPVTVYDS